MAIFTQRNVEIPLSEVVSASVSSTNVLLVTRDGNEHYCTPQSWNSATNETAIRLIPAEPGSRIIWYDKVDLPASIRVGERLIAWATLWDGAVAPVTTNGVNDGYSGYEYAYPILFPDGSVEQPEVGRFDTLDEWKAEVTALYAKSEAVRSPGTLSEVIAKVDAEDLEAAIDAIR